MTSAAIWRLCSDVRIHWRENNWPGAKTASIVCCSTPRSTQRSHTHGAKMSGRGGYEEKRWNLFLQIMEGPRVFRQRLEVAARASSPPPPSVRDTVENGKCEKNLTKYQDDAIKWSLLAKC